MSISHHFLRRIHGRFNTILQYSIYLLFFKLRELCKKAVSSKYYSDQICTLGVLHSKEYQLNPIVWRPKHEDWSPKTENRCLKPKSLKTEDRSSKTEAQRTKNEARTTKPEERSLKNEAQRTKPKERSPKTDKSLRKIMLKWFHIEYPPSLILFCMLVVGTEQKQNSIHFLFYTCMAESQTTYLEI